MSLSLHYNPDAFFVRRAFVTESVSSLIIKRGTNRSEKQLFELDAEETKLHVDKRDGMTQEIGQIDGLLGFVELAGIEFLGIIKESRQVGTYPGLEAPIFKITEVIFLPTRHITVDPQL